MKTSNSSSQPLKTSPRALLVFKHENQLGNAFQFDASAARPAGSMKAPSHSLFERLRITDFEKQPAEDGRPPRSFADYEPRITFDTTGTGDWRKLDDFIKPGESKDLGNGVTLIRRI